GFVYVREEMLERMQPLFIGAGSDTSWDLFSNPPTLEYIASAHRFDYGTQSASLMKGVSAAVAFHLEIGKEKIEARVRELNQYLFDGLTDLTDKLEIVTPAEPQSRISMLAFRPKNTSYQTTGTE